MSDLAAALETWTDPAALYDGGVSAIVIEAAARRQLVLEPETCGTCGGSGENDPPVDPVGNHIECPSCHGRGTVYPQALVDLVSGAIYRSGSLEDKAVAVLDALSVSGRSVADARNSKDDE